HFLNQPFFNSFNESAKMIGSGNNNKLYAFKMIVFFNKRKNFKFKLATCAFVNFAVIENTFLYAVVSNFISLLNASLAVRYPNILRGRLFIHCWIFLIV